MGVCDDRFGHVPAFPAGLRGPVAEVDVLAVETEAGIEAAEVVEHLAAKQEDRGRHPVGRSGLRRALVELVVVDLSCLRAQGLPQGRAADERASDRRGAASRGLPAGVWELPLRAR